MAYRVKAYDSAGAESAYKTSATRTVINNTPPTISGTDTDLWGKDRAFDQKYTVTDPDSGQTITVVEKIDGTQKRSYAATSGQEYTFSVTADEWRKLLNGVPRADGDGDGQLRRSRDADLHIQQERN